MDRRREGRRNRLSSPGGEEREPRSGSYRVLLADDHAILRHGLRRTLQQASGLEVVGEAGDGLELLKMVDRLRPQMVILDISMPKLRGLEAVREIKKTHPSTKILILTMHKEREYLYEGISAGADGYLVKEDPAAELFSAIDRVRKGKIYVSPNLSDGLAEDWVQLNRGGRKGSLEAEKLSTREREVLKLIAEGKSSKEIGDLLFISTRTVERHRANMMEKLNFKKATDLVKYAIQKGYI